MKIRICQNQLVALQNKSTTVVTPTCTYFYPLQVNRWVSLKLCEIGENKHVHRRKVHQSKCPTRVLREDQLLCCYGEKLYCQDVHISILHPLLFALLRSLLPGKVHL